MRLDIPSESGSFEFELKIPPISLQANPLKRRQAKEAFKKEIPKTSFLLSGDVHLEIEWSVHERDRYQSAFASDVDNVMKPLVDSLCGPEGIIINDNQMQSIHCYWIDSYSGEQSLRLRFKYVSDDFVTKEGLIFVEYEKSLCLPLHDNIPVGLMKEVAGNAGKMMSDWKGLIDKGMDYYDAMRVLPIQRVFHKAHLKDFRCVKIGELLK